MIRIETTSKNKTLKLSKDRYWNNQTYRESPLKKTILRTINNLKDPKRIALNDEKKFQRDCQRRVHRKSYGRPWSLGGHFFSFLKEGGIKPEHRVLDFGCGSGRLGLYLIDYLNVGNYFGIDSHVNSLRAFVEFEIPQQSLENKSPRLLLDDNFNLDYFNTQFDFVVETSVTQHLLEDSDAMQAHRKISEVLQAGGTYIVSPPPRFSLEEMQAQGLELTEEKESVFEVFVDTEYEERTYWNIYQKKTQE